MELLVEKEKIYYGDLLKLADTDHGQWGRGKWWISGRGRIRRVFRNVWTDSITNSNFSKLLYRKVATRINLLIFKKGIDN